MPTRLAPLHVILSVVVALAVGGQLVVLYLPEQAGPETVAHADKAVHALVFALPVLLAGMAWRRWRWMALAMALHAPISEVVQHTLLPRRSGDVLDVVADLVGVGAAVLAVHRWRSALARRGRGRW